MCDGFIHFVTTEEIETDEPDVFEFEYATRCDKCGDADDDGGLIEFIVSRAEAYD